METSGKFWTIKINTLPLHYASTKVKLKEKFEGLSGSGPMSSNDERDPGISLSGTNHSEAQYPALVRPNITIMGLSEAPVGLEKQKLDPL